MADLSAQHSELRQRVQNLEESLTSTTSPAESLLQASKGRKAHSIDKLIERLIKKGPTKIYGVKRCSSGYTTLYVNNDKKTPCIRGMKKKKKPKWKFQETGGTTKKKKPKWKFQETGGRLSSPAESLLQKKKKNSPAESLLQKKKKKKKKKK